MSEKRNKQRRYRISNEVATQLGLKLNPERRYRLSEELEQEYLNIQSDPNFDNLTQTQTNQYPTGKSILSAVKPNGQIMTIREYCDFYGIDYSHAKSYKLVTHTGNVYYNIASNNLDGGLGYKEEVQEYIDSIKHVIKEGVDWSDVTPINSEGDTLFVPCIFDLHLGKMGWSEETRDGDYDIKIAERRFKEALEDLITKASGYKTNRILFIMGNDFFNSDGNYPFTSTTSGTPQEDDTRWQKSFRLGVRLITEAIIRLSQIAPVDVVTALSNHDYQKVFYFGEVISAVFEGNPNVTVDNSPAPRKYYTFGKNLIGVAHGHNEKPEMLPMLMAHEAQEAWSKTFYKEWLLGHIHHSKKLFTQGSKDYNGVKVTYVTSPSSADSWHSKKGFIGSFKGAEAFIYDSEEGLIGTVIHNIK